MKEAAHADGFERQRWIEIAQPLLNLAPLGPPPTIGWSDEAPA